MSVSAISKLAPRLKRPVFDALYFARFSPSRAMEIRRMTRRVSPTLPVGERFSIPLTERAPLQLRAGTTDIDIFEQIFLRRDCAVSLGKDPRLIIDGGAHVGCSAAFFAVRYPNAKIIAVEAQKDNFDLLQANAKGFPNITCIHGAVWGNDMPLMVQDVGAGSWSFRVAAAGTDAPKQTGVEVGGGVRVGAFTINKLLEMSGQERIGLLKLDIEGAELEVFLSPCDGWLSKTDAIIIELHEGHKPGCIAAFEAATGRYPFRRRSDTAHNRVLVRGV